MEAPPAIWLVVLLCAAAAQLLKLLVYSAAQRRLALSMLAESVGLPSLHAATLTCLAMQMGLRVGWGATETALSVVFAVIVIHDAMRLKGDSQQQKWVLFLLVQAVPGSGVFQRRVADLLNVRAHHPLHVAIGALFGLLFALAFV
jgi:acid phosphatase family membrane protein YuiD